MSTAPQAPVHEPAASIGDLLGDITKDISTLLRQEVELAKAELRETASSAGKGAGLFGGATVFAHLTLVFLALAAWWALGNGIGRGWAGLVTAAVLAAIAAALALVGRKELQSLSGLSRTTDTVKKIPDAVKGNEGNAR